MADPSGSEGGAKARPQIRRLIGADVRFCFRDVFEQLSEMERSGSSGSSEAGRSVLQPLRDLRDGPIPC